MHVLSLKCSSPGWIAAGRSRTEITSSVGISHWSRSTVRIRGAAKPSYFDSPSWCFRNENFQNLLASLCLSVCPSTTREWVMNGFLLIFGIGMLCSHLLDTSQPWLKTANKGWTQHMKAHTRFFPRLGRSLPRLMLSEQKIFRTNVTEKNVTPPSCPVQFFLRF
jgi:hypothetical protein